MFTKYVGTNKFIILEKPYKHQSMFWSDLGSAVGYEAIGLVDSSLPTVAIFAKQDSSDEKRTPYDDKNKTETTEMKSTPGAVQITAKDCPPGTTNDSLENYGKGVLFYMQGEKIVGILLWNVFNRMSVARKILMSEDTFEDLNEVAKLFDIFEQQNQDKQN